MTSEAGETTRCGRSRASSSRTPFKLVDLLLYATSPSSAQRSGPNRLAHLVISVTIFFSQTVPPTPLFVFALFLILFYFPVRVRVERAVFSFAIYERLCSAVPLGSRLRLE